MLQTLALLRDRVEFKDPLALTFVSLAAAYLVLGAVVYLLMRRLRPLRTRGSSYPLVGRIKLWLIAACVLILAGLAAAQPQFAYGGSSFKRGTVDLPILIDVSASMWVKDLGPSRLEIAIRELMNLQTEGILQTGDRMALFVFGGTTIRKVHLSSNIDRVMEAIGKLRPPEALSGDSFPWGSDVAGALEQVYRSIDLQDRFEAGVDDRNWRPVRRTDRAVIVLTDGDFEVQADELQRVDAALAEFRRRGLALYPVGVGTRSGIDLSSILRDYQPGQYDSSLVAELNGQQTQLRPSTLMFLAERTSGKAFSLDNAGQSAVGFLREAVAAHRGLTLQLVPSRDSLDAWQYFVAGAILLVALAVLFY